MSNERMTLESDMKAIAAHESHLADAVKQGKWMTAVWKVEKGNLFFVGRTTWNFPTGDLIAAASMLQVDCKKEADDSPMTSFGKLLPRAHEALGGEEKPPFGVVNTEPIGESAGLEGTITSETKEINETPTVRTYPNYGKVSEPICGGAVNAEIDAMRAQEMARAPSQENEGVKNE